MQTADMIGCRRWQPIVLADEYLQSSPLPELPRSAKSGQRCRSRPTAVVDGRACCNLIGHCVFWFEFNLTSVLQGRSSSALRAQHEDAVMFPSYRSKGPSPSASSVSRSKHRNGMLRTPSQGLRTMDEGQGASQPTTCDS